MWSIAIKTLIADRGKLLTALVGVVFSIVLVNIQGGLFVGLIRKASLLIDSGEADIWVGHRRMNNVDFTHDVPRRWVDRIRGIPGVAAAEPYLIGHGSMTLPSGGFEPVEVVGCDPNSLLGGAGQFAEGGPESLLRPDGVMIDEFDSATLEYTGIGDIREINGRRARIFARTQGIVGFLITPYVFTTIDRAALMLRKEPEVCSYFLVRLAEHADRDQVLAEIRRRVPEADAQSREDYARMSVQFWMTRTGLGISFGAATCLGLLVGLVMVAQTLYASVLDRISEFGALKAMGADERQIFTILLTQALSMAIAGAQVGLGLVVAIQSLFSSPRAPIMIPWWLSLGSCALVVTICLVSSLLPYLRVRGVDPVIVLQG
jgi:putative ABC transport system permease protein